MGQSVNLNSKIIVFLLLCGTVFGSVIRDDEKFAIHNTYDFGTTGTRGKNLYFVNIDGTTVTDGTLNINGGSITSGVNATFSGTGFFGGVVTIEGLGTGGQTDYDLKVGDTDGTPTYGMIQIGNSCIGRTSFKAGNIDLDGSMIYRNIAGPVTSEIEHVFVESTGDSTRFALAKAGVGNATYNSRSMLIAGPAPADTDYVKVSYWQTNNSIFDNLVCDTSGTGADLGVQNDLEVEGDIFVDSIKESTTGADITFGHDISGVGGTFSGTVDAATLTANRLGITSSASVGNSTNGTYLTDDNPAIAVNYINLAGSVAANMVVQSPSPFVHLIETDGVTDEKWLALNITGGLARFAHFADSGAFGFNSASIDMTDGDWSFGFDVGIAGNTVLNGGFLIDLQTDSADAVITMDGSGNAPGTITYTSTGTPIFTFDKDLKVVVPAVSAIGMEIDGTTNPYTADVFKASLFFNRINRVVGGTPTGYPTLGIGTLINLNVDTSYTGTAGIAANKTLDSKIWRALSGSIFVDDTINLNAGGAATTKLRYLGTIFIGDYEGDWTQDQDTPRDNSFAVIGGSLQAKNTGTFDITNGTLEVDFIGGEFKSIAMTPTYDVGTPTINYVATDIIADGETTSVSTSIGVRISATNSDTNTAIKVIAGTADILDAVMGDFAGGNYTQVETDGTLEFNGDATVWDDLRIPVSSARVLGPGGTFPPIVTSYKGGFTLAFEDQAVNEQSIFFTAQLPHSYKAGTDIVAHIHWTPEDDSAGNVAWEFTHSWANEEAVFPGETTVNVTTAADTTIDKHQIDIISTMDGTGKTISSVIICSLLRNSGDASDTYNGLDANLHEIDFHFEKDTVGSRGVLTK